MAEANLSKPQDEEDNEEEEEIDETVSISAQLDIPDTRLNSIQVL